jgi:hypothetical protein
MYLRTVRGAIPSRSAISAVRNPRFGRVANIRCISTSRPALVSASAKTMC